MLCLYDPCRIIVPVYTVLHISHCHLVTEQTAPHILILILSRTLARSPSTSQALTGIPALPSPSITSTLKAIMNTWQPSGQWVMSSRTMTGKLHRFVLRYPTSLILSVTFAELTKYVEAKPIKSYASQIPCNLLFSNF